MKNPNKKSIQNSIQKMKGAGLSDKEIKTIIKSEDNFKKNGKVIKIEDVKKKSKDKLYSNTELYV